MMGAGSLICVVAGGEFKVAQRAQYYEDYERQGVGVLGEMRAIVDSGRLDEFRRKVLAAEFASPEYISALWETYGLQDDGFMAVKDVELFVLDHPEFLLSTGYRILSLILERAPGIKLENKIYFAGRSSLCEYAYVVDLDKNMLEVYMGFNKKDLDESERFAEFTMGGEEYRPVRFLVSFDLNNLPDEAEFVSVCYAAETALLAGEGE